MSVFSKAREAVKAALDVAEARVAALVAEGKDKADEAVVAATVAAAKAKEALGHLTDVDTE